MRFEFVFESCALAFFRAQLHFGDQAAEVLIAGAGGDEEGQAEFTSEREAGTNSRLLMVGILRLSKCFSV